MVSMPLSASCHRSLTQVQTKTNRHLKVKEPQDISSLARSHQGPSSSLLLSLELAPLRTGHTNRTVTAARNTRDALIIATSCEDWKPFPEPPRGPRCVSLARPRPYGPAESKHWLGNEIARFISISPLSQSTIPKGQILVGCWILLIRHGFG